MINWTPELIEDYKRSMDDIEYFSEKHIKFNHPVHGMIPLALNNFQKDAIKDYKEKNIFAKITKRQDGKTLIAAVILLHQALFNRHRVSLILAPKLMISNSILELIANLYENLPEHIRNAKITKRNKTILEFDNKCSIISGGSNVYTCRGLTLSNVYIDESEFMTSLDDVFRDLYSHLASTNDGRIFAFTSTRTSEYFKE